MFLFLVAGVTGFQDYLGTGYGKDAIVLLFCLPVFHIMQPFCSFSFLVTDEILTIP